VPGNLAERANETGKRHGQGEFMLASNKIYCMDCMQGIRQIEDNSIDLILCDLPYGVTKNKKDIPLPIDELWTQYKRVIKDNGVVILTSQFPFSIDLINSNKAWFRYDLIWNKILPSGFLNANKMALRVHEHILVFYRKQPTYNPQFNSGKPSHSKGSMKTDINRNYGVHGKVDNCKLHGSKKFPLSIIKFPKPHSSKALHPTEKPVELFKYLIRTYSNKGDMVLDNCIGVGTTAIACKELGRNFIGFEIDPKYCRIAKKRIAQLTSCS